MANTTISLVNLDFDTLKAQLKTYLKSQTQFSDYDFDGSNMSVLLDVLTYNTHLNAFYLNMVASEMFLDSAQLRSSAVSIAKALNYTPRSAKSSKAIITAKFAQSGLSVFTIPKNTRFTGRNSRGTFQFLTSSALVLYPAGGFFTATNLELFEGTRTTDAFVVDYSVEGQRFVLTNDLIDVDSIEVSVTETGGVTQIEYLKASSLIGVNSSSKVYFVQAAENSKYEIVFGDGVFGQKPKDGSVVTVSYRITAGPEGNESTNFTLNDNLGAVNGYGSSISPTITVVNTSFGGGDQESIDEIKYRAPRSYQTQDRAITTSDFTTLVTQEFQSIKNVHVYGGEKVTDFPRYGTVYVVPITFTGELLSEAEKTDIQEYLRERTSISTTPVVIDPEYLYIGVSSTVKFRPELTSLTAVDIEAAVKQTITEFNETQLSDFNTELSLSRLETAINETDVSITTNQTELILTKVVQVTLNKQFSFSVDFRNAIVPGSVTSSKFMSLGRTYQYTDLNPINNTLTVSYTENIPRIVNSTNTLYLADVSDPSTVTYTVSGSVDYSTGKVSVNPIEVNSLYDSPGISVSARPLEQDVASKLNDIIFIDSNDTQVSVRKN
jgi:hypothetical protein